jgi:hypothetical protein
VKGHLQGLVLIETISPRLDRQLFMALRHTIFLGTESMRMQSHAGVANHVDLICQPTCYTRPNQKMAKVDLNMQVPTQNDNSEHSPFGEGAKLNLSKQRMFILQHRIKTKEHNNASPPGCNCIFSLLRGCSGEATTARTNCSRTCYN